MQSEEEWDEWEEYKRLFWSILEVSDSVHIKPYKYFMRVYSDCIYEELDNTKKYALLRERRETHYGKETDNCYLTLFDELELGLNVIERELGIPEIWLRCYRISPEEIKRQRLNIIKGVGGLNGFEGAFKGRSLRIDAGLKCYGYAKLSLTDESIAYKRKLDDDYRRMEAEPIRKLSLLGNTGEAYMLEGKLICNGVNSLSIARQSSICCGATIKIPDVGAKMEANILRMCKFLGVGPGEEKPTLELNCSSMGCVVFRGLNLVFNRECMIYKSEFIGCNITFKGAATGYNVRLAHCSVKAYKGLDIESVNSDVDNTIEVVHI